MATLTELRAIANNGPLDEASKSKNAKPFSSITKGVKTVGLIGTFAIAVVGGILLTPILTIKQKIVSNDRSKIKTLYTSSQYNTLIEQMTKIQSSLIQKQKQSKWYNLVYKYHKNESFGEVTDNKFHKIDIKKAFNDGLAVEPELAVMYYEGDCVAVEPPIYKTLVDGIPEDVKDPAVYYRDTKRQISDEMQQHLRDLGFNVESGHGVYTSSKYSMVKIDCTNSDNGVWVSIQPADQTPIGKTDNSDTSLANLRKLSKT